MPFGGAVPAMIASLKINKRTHISTFDKTRRFNKSKKNDLDFNSKASPKELQEINAKKIKIK
jgi:hypothetical protein|tara:strand:- start:705 stop:890 length:186 start_codon:yes stop_codon:yes gene_type:complete